MRLVNHTAWVMQPSNNTGLRYKLSLNDLAEMFSIEVDRFYFARETIRRWREKFAPLITDALKKERKGQTDLRWKIDETLIKIGSKHHYLYRVIDSQGKLVETKLSPVRTLESTKAFLKAAVATTDQQPKQITTDKEVTYPGAIEKILGKQVEHRTERYLNNRMDQDHRGIKARYQSMKGFKQFESAEVFCQAFNEQREFFKWRRWHSDWRSNGWKRADFKAKFYKLAHQFSERKLVWRQLPLLV